MTGLLTLLQSSENYLRTPDLRFFFFCCCCFFLPDHLLCELHNYRFKVTNYMHEINWFWCTTRVRAVSWASGIWMYLQESCSLKASVLILSWNTCITLAVFRQSSEVPTCLSFWRLGVFRQRAANSGICCGPPIFRLGGYTYFRLACYLKTRRKCASLRMGWAEVSMTCTVVQRTAKEF